MAAPIKTRTWKDHFVHATWRSSRFTRNTSGTVPDPFIITDTADEFRGGCSGLNSGTGSTFNAITANTDTFTVAQNARFFARWKLEAFDPDEYDFVDCGLTSGLASSTQFIQFILYPTESTYKIFSTLDSGVGETETDTGVDVPDDGDPTPWIEIEFKTFSNSLDAQWRFTIDSVMQAHGTVPAATLPTGNLLPYIRVGKSSSGTRATELYVDRLECEEQV